jgi:hypothetical protein
MNPARKGKIARLPAQLREQVNLRLQNRETAETIRVWLNSEPKVKAILTAQFAGNPISKQNICEWRQGGFRDWQTRKDALQFVEHVDDVEALSHDPSPVAQVKPNQAKSSQIKPNQAKQFSTPIEIQVLVSQGTADRKSKFS